MVEIEIDWEIIATLDKLNQPRALKWSMWNSIRTKAKQHHRSWEEFQLQAFTFTSHGIVEVQFYADDGGALTLMSKDEVPMKMLTWLAIFLLLCFPSSSKPQEALSATTHSELWDNWAMTNQRSWSQEKYDIRIYLMSRLNTWRRQRTSLIGIWIKTKWEWSKASIWLNVFEEKFGKNVWIHVEQGWGYTWGS